MSHGNHPRAKDEHHHLSPVFRQMLKNQKDPKKVPRKLAQETKWRYLCDTNNIKTEI